MQVFLKVTDVTSRDESGEIYLNVFFVLRHTGN